MSSAGSRTRLGIIILSGAALLFFATQSASMGGGDPIESFAFVIAMYGVPFALFAFGVWTSRWGRSPAEAGIAPMRHRVGMTAEALALMSSGLYLLTLPCTSFIAEHESLGAFWILAGIITALLGTICFITGSPRRWMKALLIAFLVPCWMFSAALFAKMMMD